ncbi:MAG: photosynthetic reaction center subunit H [Pseudomonadota bacterium]
MIFGGEYVDGIDLVDISLWLFTIFFIGLVFYLQAESRREGYPEEHDTTGRVNTARPFFERMKKRFRLPHGREDYVPEDAPRDARELAMRRTAAFAGAPYVPTGDPMLDGVGPASFAERQDVPDLTLDGEHRIAPYRASPGYKVSEKDPDPRGMRVLGADGKIAGEIVDLWVDRSEAIIRYYEVGVPMTDGSTRRVLLPVPFASINSNRGREHGVNVKAITAEQFTRVPVTRDPDSVTRLEEDKITGYYGGGTLYAMKSRQEPLL